jgi:hypothetical protein
MIRTRFFPGSKLHRNFSTPALQGDDGSGQRCPVRSVKPSRLIIDRSGSHSAVEHEHRSSDGRFQVTFMICTAPPRRVTATAPVDKPTKPDLARLNCLKGEPLWPTILKTGVPKIVLV